MEKHTESRTKTIVILSILVVVLIGWNISQLIYFNEKENQIDELKDQTEKRLSEIQHKLDFYRALTEGIRSQNASLQFYPNPRKKELTKFTMIKTGIKALNFLTEFPEYEREVINLSETLVGGLKYSSSTKLKPEDKTIIIMKCGEIKNKERIPNLDKIINYVNNSPE